MTVEERQMPYTEYPIRYTNSKLGHKDQELYAQTLESTTFFERLNRSYGYYTSENKPVLNPTATDSPVPLAPWFPFDGSDTSAKRWGLNAASINNFLSYLKPGLNISTYSSSKASDIALAGARPVNTQNLTVTIPPVYFYPNGLEYVENPTLYSAIDIVIYVSRKRGTTSPKLIVERHYFNAGSTSSAPDKTVEIHSVDIPDVPYFVFNFAVCAPGAPSTKTKYRFLDSKEHVLYLTPGGGSGAGAQFTAILSTNPVNLTPVQSHTDKITIRYTLARQSYSSSLAGFDPTSVDEADNGIDVVKVTADLRYTVVSADRTLHYPYSRQCTLPGGLIYPGLKASYFSKAKTIINNFRNNKDAPELVTSTFPTDSVLASMASALIFHKADWMLPELQDSLANTNADLPEYQLSHPITVFNPEALFPSSSTTKIGNSPYTGAAGRPSILYNGASTNPESGSPPVLASSGQRGAGGSGSIWYGADTTPEVLTSDGGTFTIILSW